MAPGPVSGDVVLPDWLERRAFLSPGKTGLVCGETRLTFAQWHARAERVARRLKESGIAPGDRVAVLLPNGLAFAEWLYGVPRAGGVLVPLNLRLAPEEWVWQLQDAEVRHVAYDPAWDEVVPTLAAHCPRVTWHRVAGDDLESGGSGQHELEEPAPEARIEPARGGDAPGFPLSRLHSIIYTSGTTGRPKGAGLTFGNFWWSAVASALNLGLHHDDRWLACLPLFHVGGLSILLRSVIYGTTAVIHRGRFDPAAVNRTIDDEGITLISVVSNMLQRMLDERGTKPYPDTLRCVLVGGGPVPRPLLEECVRRRIPVVQTYGLTETASQVATLSPADAVRKLGSAGQPLFPTRVRIERKDGSEAAPGEVGEILVAGPTVMPCYVGRPRETAEAWRGGWFHTGDLGYVDEEGYLYVVDRRTDLIISGGENVYPAEVEAVLLRHPQVEEAGVVGVPDDRWGQVVGAAVKLRPGADVDAEALRRFCREHLGAYKVPAHIRFVDALPRNAAGKLLRRKLKELFVREPIFYRDVGPSGAAAWVFIHGDLSDGEATWFLQVQEMAGAHRLLVVDRRGYGRSPKEPRPYTIQGDAEDVLEVMGRAGVEKVHLVGHSYGGLVALEAARRRPDRVLSLHLIEPPYFSLLPSDPEVIQLRQSAAAVFQQARHLEAEAVAEAFFEMLGGPRLLESARSKPEWAAIVRDAKRIGWQMPPWEYPAEALAELAGDFPVLIYTGGRSHPGLQRVARRLAALIPRARLIHIPEATHAVQRIGEPFQRVLLSVTA